MADLSARAGGPDPLPAPQPVPPPRFRGCAAVITGGARGIGKAHAIALAREGCDIVIGDILEDLPDGPPYEKATQAELDQTASQVQALGVRCVAVRADVRRPEDGERLIELAMNNFGRLDILIANAALTIENELAQTSPEAFDTVIRTNLNGAFHVMAPALRVMSRAGRGRVILIGSGAGRHAEEKAGPYVASKWALIGLAKTAALEVAKSGVTVNVVLPGPTDTAMMNGPTRYRQAAPDKADPTREDYLRAKAEATPMGLAWIKPEDVAAASLFLASDEARFISGVALSVDAADCAKWT